MANLSGRHLNLRCNEIIISLFVTLWKCSTRWFWHVYISRIPFGVFKLSLSKVSWCVQLMLGVYLFQWSVHSEPSLWIYCVSQNAHRSPWGWWYTISPYYRGSVLVQILKVSKHCLKIKTHQPAINIAIMPLSWVYECPVLIQPGLQNCNKWLRNSIIYSTSCQTDHRTPSTIYRYKIQGTIDKVVYTSMPPPYLHSVSLLSKRSVTSLCQQTSRVVYPEDYLQQLAPEEANFFPIILDHPHPSI